MNFPIPSSGSYLLHLELEHSREIAVGALGVIFFPAGDYLYAGSARRNMAARIRRHLRRDKPLRWHIDYLSASDRIKRIFCCAQPMELELAAAIARLKGSLPIPGFGASDSPHASHLFQRTDPAEAILPSSVRGAFELIEITIGATEYNSVL